MSVAIKVENLSKKYIIRHEKKTANYETFGETVIQGSKNIANKAIHPFTGKKIDSQTQEEFWALKDINFEINQGDKVGIIGRNGAGKSTLLKVISRITEPSSGKIHINGRIASLLEVGTGFHPELTGRENIYLNGAILGMSRREIKAKFDEIVAFSEVDKFLDTPVKRYSSGMYVRLAFSVAAHLEPEILVVDEVLAVGDAAFQKKCLGKMDDVSKEGRTILFVSHNMGTVRNLCTKAIMLNHGKIIVNDRVNRVVDKYLSYGQELHGVAEIIWDENNAPSCNEVALKSIRLIGAEKKVYSIYDATKPINVEIKFRVKKPVRGMRVVMSLLTTEGVIAFSSTNQNLLNNNELKPDSYITTCVIYGNLLNSARYIMKVHLGIPGVKVLIQGKEYLSFIVEGAGGHGSTFPEKWPGSVAPSLKWGLYAENKIGD